MDLFKIFSADVSSSKVCFVLSSRKTVDAVARKIGGVFIFYYFLFILFGLS